MGHQSGKVQSRRPDCQPFPLVWCLTSVLLSRSPASNSEAGDGGGEESGGGPGASEFMIPNAQHFVMIYRNETEHEHRPLETVHTQLCGMVVVSLNAGTRKDFSSALVVSCGGMIAEEPNDRTRPNPPIPFSMTPNEKRRMRPPPPHAVTPT